MPTGDQAHRVSHYQASTFTYPHIPITFDPLHNSRWPQGEKCCNGHTYQPIVLSLGFLSSVLTLAFIRGTSGPIPQVWRSS